VGCGIRGLGIGDGDQGDHGCRSGGLGVRGLCLYIAYVYIYIAELIALYQIKSAMDSDMNRETQAIISHNS